MNERKVLGRGLSSLIRPQNLGPSDRVDAQRPPLERAALSGVPLEVSISDIHVNPRQPRKNFSALALEELKDSILSVGILQPLVVRKTNRGYELIAGERRLRAARLAGKKTVPVVFRSSTDQDQLEVALIENLQRENLSPMEEALGYEKLMREFFLTQDAVAQKVGKDRSTVANLLRLLKLPKSIQKQVDLGELSMGHARTLLALDHEREQELMAAKTVRENLSVRALESLIREKSQTKAKKKSTTSQTQTSPNLRFVAEEFQRVLGTKVEIHSSGKTGEVRIHYYSSEDLDRLKKQILRSF